MQIIGSIRNYPARVLAVWYLGMIVIGSAVLMHPNCRAAGADSIRAIDAVFTSTSATCVTGLAVRSTGHDFSWLGQAVILLLIQIGGIGIMTITTYVMFSFGRQENLRHRAVLNATMGTDASVDLPTILRDTLGIMLIVESTGFAILALRNLIAGMPFAAALWHGLFHSISAFCNAGFALHDDSLMQFQGDVVVNFTIMSLITIGGIGFPVIVDLKHHWHLHWKELWERLTLHSKLMLIGTAVLILFGTISLLILEWKNTLHGIPLWERPMIAMFHSVTCRTAGFNSVEIANLTNAMLFVSVLLMAIGAGPGSTAGGIKVSTLAILALRSWSSLRGRQKINLFHRTIPRKTAVKAMVAVMLFLAIAVLALTVLLAFEQAERPHMQSKGIFLDATFEIISALATVGLSTGLTTHLDKGGRVIVILLMYIGRLGPITIFTALSQGEQTSQIEYSNEEPLIG